MVSYPSKSRSYLIVRSRQSKTASFNIVTYVGYGTFTRKEFAYSDYKISEIIAGYGRLSINKWRK
jgi:hypothetical protein